MQCIPERPNQAVRRQQAKRGYIERLELLAGALHIGVKAISAIDG